MATVTDCHMARERLSSYVDAQLPEAERAELEAHLAGCAGCRSELSSLTQMLRVLRAVKAPAAPDLVSGVRERLARRPWWQTLPAKLPRVSLAWRPMHGLALAATAVLVIVVVGLPQFVQQPEPLEDRFDAAKNEAVMLGREIKTNEAVSAEEPEVVTHDTERGRDNLILRSSNIVGSSEAAGGPPSDIGSLVDSYAYFDSNEDQKKEGKMVGQLPMIVRWQVQDVQDAVLQVMRWVQARGGNVHGIDGRHLEIELAAGDVEAFLKEFSSPLEGSKGFESVTSDTASGSLAVLSPQSPRVTISLELIVLQ